MKRIACLILVLSIACAGCQVNGSSTSIETALESKIAELRENITKLEGELSQVKIELKASQDKIIELETDLELQITQLRTDIIKLEGELSKTKETLLARINKLETDLESQITGLRENIAKLEKEFSQIKEALQARINKLETDLESQITELRADIIKLEGELYQVKTALKASQDKIIKLETDLESQKSEIRENISKLKKATWWIWAAIAAIISALIAGGVAVHRSRKDTKNRKQNQGSISEHEYTGLGLLGHWLSWILDTRFPREVRSDWLRVEAMHRRIDERIPSEAADPKCKSEDKVDPKDKLTPREKRKLLDRSRDYLYFAKTTHLLEDAWRHLNQASETLSIIVEDKEECAELVERFEEWEPLLDRHLKNMYGKSLAQEFKKHRKKAQKHPAKIRTHSRQWALINQANSFRIRMSRRIAFIFLVSSAVMLLTTLWIIWDPGRLAIYAPLNIFIYGWFGAALSILLAARKLKPSAITFRTLWLNLLLRLALGAGGALVTFVVVSTPGLLDDTIRLQLQEIPGFIALGIAGGFSERLFRRVLEMFTKRIVPPKPDEDSEEVDPSK